jgi:hypothetical protein
MVTLLLVEKGGDLVETKVRDFSFDTLYKKCRFRKSDGFERRAQWNVKISGESHSVVLYARDHGKSGMENKYDLPPPVDQTLYFGAMVLVAIDSDNNAIDLSEELWLRIYEKLFGGFHNLADTALEDEQEEDELAALPDHMKTKHGYLKDDFIVDDNDLMSSVHTSTSESPEQTTDGDYESELDFEEYEYMDSNDESDEDSDVMEEEIN